MELLRQQYQLIIISRASVSDICNHISDQHFVEEMNQQGASIRHLLVHIANVYLHWLVKLALNRQVEYYNPEKFINSKAVADLFLEIDKYVDQFLNEFPSYEHVIDINVPARGLMTFSVLQVFTHVITHEFHHKGQIMSKIRNLGYTPPDTDVIRFE